MPISQAVCHVLKPASLHQCDEMRRCILFIGTTLCTSILTSEFQASLQLDISFKMNVDNVNDSERLAAVAFLVMIRGKTVLSRHKSLV